MNYGINRGVYDNFSFRNDVIIHINGVIVTARIVCSS